MLVVPRLGLVLEGTFVEVWLWLELRLVLVDTPLLVKLVLRLMLPDVVAAVPPVFVELGEEDTDEDVTIADELCDTVLWLRSVFVPVNS